MKSGLFDAALFIYKGCTNSCFSELSRAKQKTGCLPTVPSAFLAVQCPKALSLGFSPGHMLCLSRLCLEHLPFCMHLCVSPHTKQYPVKPSAHRIQIPAWPWMCLCFGQRMSLFHKGAQLLLLPLKRRVVVIPTSFKCYRFNPILCGVLKTVTHKAIACHVKGFSWPS